MRTQCLKHCKHDVKTKENKFYITIAHHTTQTKHVENPYDTALHTKKPFHDKKSPTNKHLAVKGHSYIIFRSLGASKVDILMDQSHYSTMQDGCVKW